MELQLYLATWASAVEAWDKGESQVSLDFMTEIADPSSKILFNIGRAYLALEDLGRAEKFFSDAIAKDEHMAIAYFERACVHFKAGRFREAIEDFLACQIRFRSRSVIDYSQLGLKYKLYLCEAQFNIGVSEACLGDLTSAEENIRNASKQKVELRHRYMKDSLGMIQKGKLPDLAKIPRHAVYRPPKGKVDNMEKRDYLGKAKVISSVDHGDGFSGFVGPKKLEEKQKLMPDSHHSMADIGKTSVVTNKSTLEELTNSLSLTNHSDTRSQSPDALQTGSAPNSPKVKPKLMTQRSKDDSFINEKPELPPKRLMPPDCKLLTRTGPLPPPPNRPPPKLDRKPLPPEPGAKSGSTIKQVLVKVEIHCNTVQVVEVTHGVSLECLVSTASQHFGFEKDSINLWRKNTDGGQVPILTDVEMNNVWEETKNQLSLWCYARQ